MNYIKAKINNHVLHTVQMKVIQTKKMYLYWTFWENSCIIYFN